MSEINNTSYTSKDLIKKYKHVAEDTNRFSPVNDTIVKNFIAKKNKVSQPEDISLSLTKRTGVNQNTDLVVAKKLDEISAVRLKKPLLKPKAKNHKKWKLKKVLVGHMGWVRCLAIDPSNEYFVSGSTDSTIKFWDLATGALKVTLTGHVSTIRALAISKTFTYLFSASEDKSVRCWDLTTNKCIRKYHGHLAGAYSLSLHPSQPLLATGGRDAAIRLWDIRTRHEVFCFEGHEDAVNAVILQNDEPQLYSGSADSTIKLWDIRTGTKIKGLTQHYKGVRAMAGHSIEYSFASGGGDGMKVWKFPDGEFMRNIELKGIINSMDISPEDVLVAGLDNGSIGLFDWSSGDMFQMIKSTPQPGSLEAEAGIFDTKFDLSGLRLLSAECDKTIKIWEQYSDE